MAAKTGRSPEALKNRPELFEDLTPVWNAFAGLHMTRPSGFGPCAVPMESIRVWLDLHEIHDLDDRVEFLELIQAMDAAWLAWANEKMKAKT